MSTVVIGRSSRSEVFTALGRPGRTEQSADGETWRYEATDAPDPVMSSGATAATGLVGAFVPYGALIGPGLGLASAARQSRQEAPSAASLLVRFNSDGVVADCVYATSALPAGIRAGGPIERPVIGCAR